MTKKNLNLKMGWGLAFIWAIWTLLCIALYNLGIIFIIGFWSITLVALIGVTILGVIAIFRPDINAKYNVW